MSYPRITGENISYLYNRDHNTKVFPLYGQFYASYGTSLKFSNRVVEIKGRDHYTSSYPIGLNSMTAEVNLMMNDISDAEAGTIIRAMQKVLAEEGTGRGYINLARNNSTPLNTGEASAMYLNLEGGTDNHVYNSLEGFFVQEWNDQHKENFLHDVSITLRSNTKSPYLNYWGLYANSGDIAYWDTGVAYQTNDIVFFPKFENAMDNFFYCTSDHTSATGTSPEFTGSPWTQSFDWEPDYKLVVNNGDRVNLENFKEGLINRIKKDRNEQFLDLALSFENRSNRETRAILHFLENRMGYKPFPLELPGIYRAKKFFVAREWEHEFVYYDVNNLTVRMIERVRIANNKEINTSNFWNVV